MVCYYVTFIVFYVALIDATFVVNAMAPQFLVHFKLAIEVHRRSLVRSKMMCRKNYNNKKDVSCFRYETNFHQFFNKFKQVNKQ